MSEEITERYYVRRREFLNEYSELPAFIIGIVKIRARFLMTTRINAGITEK